MRPIRLEVQGLTSFRQPVVVDFSELDLFAITGPTGAGKSSLVDAITYALFGQVPRVGRGIKELISQGEDRLKVSLDFTVGGQRYRIFRESGRKQQKPPQLERFDAASDDWLPEEVDRVKDTNAYIEQLLRMDYDAFIRSVLLPQGEFQQFLAGDRDERRKVLDGLLRLGVYAVMGQKANAIAAREGADAERIEERLERELSDATPERLREAKATLAQQKAEVETALAAREALEAAHRAAETLSGARERERKARDALAVATSALSKAQDDAKTGKAKESERRMAIEALNKRLAANSYDEAAFLRYQKAATIAVEIERDEREASEFAKRSVELEKESAGAAAAVEKAAQAYEKAKAESEHASHALLEVRSANAAAALQKGLKPGDDCPVCGGRVGTLPKVAYGKMDDAIAADKKAKAAEEAAGTALRAAESKRDRATTQVEAHANAGAQASAKAAERQKALGEALAGDTLRAAEIAVRLERLESARSERTSLANQIDDENRALNQIVTAMAEATANLARLGGQVEAGERGVALAGEEVAKAEAALRGLAAAMPEVIAAVDGGMDAATVVARRLGDARLQHDAAVRATATAEARIDQIEKDIELAKALRKQEKAHRETATLSRDLASLLQTNRFPTFIRERALQTLARDGSERLEEISSGRYSFQVEGQDFLIEDRWNGGETRSVKTLSGGETFLASLALALALAEHLPGLSGDGAGSALESLFIDEGFSHLDDGTLDQVASALEVLGQDRGRLIGLITHLPALAERMPARIVVHKAQGGSTVTVE